MLTDLSGEKSVIRLQMVAVAATSTVNWRSPTACSGRMSKPPSAGPSSPPARRRATSRLSVSITSSPTPESTSDVLRIATVRESARASWHAAARTP
jgi:hypothetical protein